MTTKWDLRFLRLAREVASWSRDPSTKTGAIIVRPDKTIASVGFNGFPRQMRDWHEHYEDRKEKYSRIIHAEVNALLHAHESVHGCTLYTWPFASCDRCCVQMIQAGIACFVFPEPSPDALSRWGTAFEKTKQYIYECGLTRREYTLEELIH